MKPTFTSRLLFVVMAMFVLANVSIAQQTETISLQEDRVRHLLSDFTGQETVVEICDLRPGETYRVWAVQQNSCKPTAYVVGGKDQTPQANFDFIAQSDCVEMVYQKGDLACNEGMYLSLLCTTIDIQSDFDEKVDKKLQGQADASGIIVFPNSNTTSLVEDVFIGGGCFDVENVTPIGPDAGRGQFDDGGSTVIIKGGIILESGTITNALGPNNSNSAGNNIGGGGDPDLAQLTTAGIFDAVGFEFDFTPTVDSLTFEFAFASEEYCEYVGSTFNDVFGFFISGPGINGPYTGGAVNIAQLPNGTTVAINNVNHQANTGFFVGNQNNCGGFFNEPDIQFDGWTVPVQANAILQACETYHIKLVVGDAGDGIFDSAVFLKAGSFTAGNAISAEAISASTGTNLIYEPCNDGTLNFLRVAGDITQPLIYDIFLDPSSTATPGVDYAPLPTQVVIPPGEAFISIPIDVFPDGIPEGVETIVLTMDNACSCFGTEIIIEIADLDPIEMELPPVEVCVGEVVTLDPAPTGGTGFYEFEWNTGDTDPIIVVVPPAPPNYTVTVTDNCGSSSVESTIITVNQLPTANLSGNPLSLLCAEDPTSSVEMEISFTGNAPWTFVYSIDGVPQDPITTSDNPYILTTSEPGAYEMTGVTSSADCEGTAFGVVFVDEAVVTADLQADPVTCILGGTLFANFNGGVPASYQWSDPTLPNPNDPVQVDVPAGTYSVTITDLNGCTAEAENTVETVDPLIASSSFTNIDCSTGNAGTIEVVASSGSEPINYNWSNGLPNSATQNGLSAGTYFVTIFDNIGCTIVDSMTILNNSIPPAAIANAPEILNCNNINTQVLGNGSATGNNITYQWTGPGIVSGANEINATVDASGTYVLVVTDNDSGCTSEDETEVLIDTAPPAAAATGNEILCTVSEVDLDGTGSSTGAEFTYQWTGPGIVAGGTSLNPTVNAAGTYTLTVTNINNGCTEEVEAEVTQDSNLPTAVILDPIPLDCNTNALILDGSGSSAGPSITYQWFQNGTEIPGETSTELPVSGPGSYQIVVNDGSNGCVSNYAVEVIEDLAAPPVVAVADGQFTCTQDEVGLTANVTGDPTIFTFAWSTANGSLIGATDQQNATAGSPGDYTVIITSSLNGCTSEASVNVTQDSSIPMVEIQPADELNCVVEEIQLDGTSSSQGGTLTYTWTTVGGNFINGQNTLEPTIDEPGTYILTIFDNSNGCESEEQIVVDQDNEDPELSVSSPPMLDCETGSLVFEATVSNFPAGDLDILWSSADGMIDGPNNILNAETSTPGLYTITVTNINNGCEDVFNVTVSQDITPPDAIISPADELDCTNNTVTLDGGSSSTGSIYTYEWTTATGNIVTGDNTLFPVVNQDGDYVLVVTNSENNCTATESVTVNQNADVPDAFAGTDTDFTCDITQINLSGTASTGPEYAYQWTGPGVLNGGNTLNPLVDEPGTYTLIVTNQTNNCVVSDEVVLGTDYAEPTAEAGQGGQLSCSVTAMDLDGTGSSTTDVSYLWTTPDGSIVSGEATLNPEINAPGTYVLTVTNNGNGCTATDEVIIEEDDDLPNVDIALAPPITCEVFEIVLDGTGTVTGSDFIYEWSTSGTGNITNGANTLEPTVDEPGIYVLTVTNTATNCTNIASVTVDEDTDAPAAEAGVTQELTCDITTLGLNGGGSATGADISYLWSTLDGSIVLGETTLNPVINAPGTYTITVMDANNGCSSTDEVEITESTDVPIAVGIALDELTCNIIETQVTANGSSMGTEFSYAWSTSNGNIVSGGNTMNATVDEPGTYFLVVTNNANNCTATEEVTVSQNTNEPTAEAGFDVELDCDTETLDLDGTGSSAGGFGYVWTTTDGQIVSGANTLNPTIGEPGIYLLTVTDNANGCTATDEVEVGQDVNFPTVSIATPPVLTCAEISAVLNGTVPTGADIDFNWSTTDGNIVAGNQTLDIEVDEPGTYTLFVINNSNGCTNETSVTVDEDVEAPTAYAGLDFLLDCLGNFPTLNGLGSTGNGTLDYSWTTATGAIEEGEDTAEPTISLAGVYVLTVTDASNGCTDTDEVNVTTTGPSAEPEILQPGCFNELGAIVVSNVTGGTSPYQFSIDGGNTFSNDAIYADLEPGSYEIVVVDASGCVDEDQVTIIQPPLFDVTIEDFAFIVQGEEIQLNTEVNVPLDDIQEVTWNPTYGLSCTDCLNPLASPEQSTVYQVTVMTKEGCEDNATLLLEVEESAEVYVPNVFNPLSGNEDNNKFMVFTTEEKNINIKSMLIYSRWGETVFEYYNFPPNDPQYGWDGYHRGSLLNPAVFVWVAEIEFEDGRVELFKGDVSLVH